MSEGITLSNEAVPVRTEQLLGQQWVKNPFEWGMEEFCTVTTNQGTSLVLVDLVQWSEGDSGGMAYVPVKGKDLPVLPPEEGN